MLNFSMQIPTLEQAEAFMLEAEKRNPTPWANHARFVAKAARAIANVHPRLDPDTAYILGLAHDIGRQEGWSDIKHILDGYKFFMARGFDDAARICLTHSFANGYPDAYSGTWDIQPEEKLFIRQFIQTVPFDDYDRLIQLCDGLALPSGFCLLEVRVVDVMLRHGAGEHITAQIKATLKIKQDFEKEIGVSIYSLLEGVVENTFTFQHVLD